MSRRMVGRVGLVRYEVCEYGVFGNGLMTVLLYFTFLPFGDGLVLQLRRRSVITAKLARVQRRPVMRRTIGLVRLKFLGKYGSCAGHGKKPELSRTFSVMLAWVGRGCMGLAYVYSCMSVFVGEC